MFRIMWRTADGGPQRWADASNVSDLLAITVDAVTLDGAPGGELRVTGNGGAWMVYTTIGALRRWDGIGAPEGLVASAWEAEEALAIGEADLTRQLAAPLDRAVAAGILQRRQAERLLTIAGQAVQGIGPAGRDVEVDHDALAPFIEHGAAQG